MVGDVDSASFCMLKRSPNLLHPLTLLISSHQASWPAKLRLYPREGLNSRLHCQYLRTDQASHRIGIPANNFISRQTVWFQVGLECCKYHCLYRTQDPWLSWIQTGRSWLSRELTLELGSRLPRHCSNRAVATTSSWGLGFRRRARRPQRLSRRKYRFLKYDRSPASRCFQRSFHPAGI